MVGDGGFEPPKSKTTDLQSAPFDRSGTHPDIAVAEPIEGVEPTTSRLQITRSGRLSYIGKTFVCQRPFPQRDCKDRDIFQIPKHIW